jgi:hypothetical protein
MITIYRIITKKTGNRKKPNKNLKCIKDRKHPFRSRSRNRIKNLYNKGIRIGPIKRHEIIRPIRD